MTTLIRKMWEWLKERFCEKHEETPETPWATNEEHMVFGLADDLLDIRTPLPVHVIRDDKKHIPALRASWASFNNGASPRGMYWEGVFYIKEQQLKELGNTYINLIVGMSIGLDEKKTRQQLHALMRENHLI